MSRARRVTRRKTVRRAKAATTARRRRRISFGISPGVDAALNQLRAEGRKVVVLGTVKKGKVQATPAGLSELARNLPRSNFGFIALNAPFKTKVETHAV